MVYEIKPVAELAACPFVPAALAPRKTVPAVPTTPLPELELTVPLTAMALLAEPEDINTLPASVPLSVRILPDTET